MSKSKSLPRSKGGSGSSSEKLRSTFNSPKHRPKNASYVNQVVQKLKDHPDYKRMPTADVKKLATKLTDISQLEEYFSEILQVQIAEYSIVKAPTGAVTETTEHDANGGLQELTDTVDFSETDTTDEQSAISMSAIGINIPSQGACAHAPVVMSMLDSLSCPVKDLASFPVRLYLTALPHDPMMRENSYASMLEARFGPNVASLQIGKTMLEWTAHHLVIPHYNVPTEPDIKTDITEITAKLGAKARECRASRVRSGSIVGQADLMLEVSKSVYDMIKSVIKVIVTWNRFHYYNVYGRNSLDFVQHVIRILGIKEIPMKNLEPNAFRARLKSDARTTTHTTFDTHAILDSYVRQRIHELKTCDMEYLMTEYYRFHLEAREGCVGADSWTCKEADCQMQSLEQRINREELLITSLH